MIFLCAIVVFGTASSCFPQYVEVKPEYSVKAAFLYNFIRFTSWPQLNSESPSAKQFTIGILGKNPFGDSVFKSVENKPIPGKKRKLAVKYLGDYNSKVDLKQCNLIFVCASEAGKHEEIVKAVSGLHVLTVADSSDFLEKGGMINFVIRNNKVRWEINDTAVKQTRLRLSSQLYRSAVKVICK